MIIMYNYIQFFLSNLFSSIIILFLVIQIFLFIIHIYSRLRKCSYLYTHITDISGAFSLMKYYKQVANYYKIKLIFN